MLRAPCFNGRSIDSRTVKTPPGRLRVPVVGPASALLVLALGASAAFADTAADAAETVILLRPLDASPAVGRSLARIRDELLADRFHVIVADSATKADATSVMTHAARHSGGGALVVLFGDPETGHAELCVVQRAGESAAIRRAFIVEDPERMPEILAARTLELMRATALELSIELQRGPRVREPPPRAPTTDPSTPSPERSAVAVDVGLAILHSVDGPPPALMPSGRVRLRLTTSLHARVSVTGLGTRPRVETSYGSATLAQNLVLFELAAVFRADKRVRPIVSLGAGALNVSVMGIGPSPSESREPQRWSAAFDAGVGVSLGIHRRAALATEVHALLAAPHPFVRFVDIRAATIGYPSLLMTLMLQVTL
jgi:hypothetical protein